MTEKLLPPTVRPIVAPQVSLEQRVYELERRQTSPTGSSRSPLEFSYPGEIENEVESPPWYPEESVTLTGVRVSLLNAAGSALIVEIRKSGVAIVQVTLPGGLRTARTAIAIVMSGGDYLTCKTVQVPSGAANMSVGLTVA